MAGLYRQGHVPNNMDCPATGRPMAVPGPLQRGPTRIPRVSERPRETANSDPVPGGWDSREAGAALGQSALPQGPKRHRTRFLIKKEREPLITQGVPAPLPGPVGYGGQQRHSPTDRAPSQVDGPALS